MSSANSLSVKLLSANAKLPTKANCDDAGYDLYAAHDLVIPARSRALVSTDIAVAVPYGSYGRISPRSGLALKNGIDVGAGVVDPGYRGALGVILFNHSDKDFQVTKGDRVAQLILEMIIPVANVVEVDTLPATNRGADGFGSSGK
jgi:dUTP pyrophosphatase